MGPDDAALIARVLASDDRHAFATLVRRHQSPVRVFLRRLAGGNDALADDLAQETFVRAYKGLKQYRGGPRFISWLYRIAYTVFVSEHRTRARRAASELPEEVVDASVTLAPVEARHDLARAWRQLRQEEQVALALTYSEGMTHEEAAAVMEWPLGTLKALVLRGREKLREQLHEDARRTEA